VRCPFPIIFDVADEPSRRVSGQELVILTAGWSSLAKKGRGDDAMSMTGPWRPKDAAAFRGSGGSVGREGPIIGAAFGSTLGQLVAMPARFPDRTGFCAG